MSKYTRRMLKSLTTANLGENNSNVGVVQAFLVKQRHLKIDEFSDQILDEPTSAALQSFQRHFGLPESGELDNETVEVIATPRCGMRDRSLSLTEECRWNISELRYSFENFPTDVSESTAKLAVQRAFETWSLESGISFAEVPSTDPSEISLGWRDAFDSDYDMVGADVAHADYPGHCSEVSPEGVKPIHFDATECQWTDDPDWERDDSLEIPVYDIETVALHEIGHILGLRHSPIPGDVLYGAVPKAVQRELSENDRIRIRHLYDLS